jgi:hypothetical protein
LGSSFESCNPTVQPITQNAYRGGDNAGDKGPIGNLGYLGSQFSVAAVFYTYPFFIFDCLTKSLPKTPNSLRTPHKTARLSWARHAKSLPKRSPKNWPILALRLSPLKFCNKPYCNL